MLRARHFTKIAEHANAERPRPLFDGNSLGPTSLSRIDERAFSIGPRHFELGADSREPLTKLAAAFGGRLTLCALHDG